MKLFKLPAFFIIIITCFFVGSEFIYSQKVNIIINKTDSLTLNILEKEKFNKSYNNINEAKNSLKTLKNNLNRSGFLNSELLFSKQNDSTYFLKTTLNKKIDSIIIDIPTKYYSSLPISIANPTRLSYDQLTEFLKKLNSHLEESGKTFDETTLTNQRIEKNKLYTSLKISSNKTRTLDKVLFKGYKKFPNNYKTQHLKLNKALKFNKQNIRSISNKLKKLEFINQFKEPEFLFTNDSTFLYLYIRKKKINQFDGLIGFNSNANGKLIFNGHLDISLKNNFNKGETISLFWSNNGREQQDLRLHLSTPYIYNSIFSPEINLTIRKQDSTFISTSLKTKLHLNLSNKHTLSASLKNETSRNSLSDINSTVLDFTKLYYGIEHTYKHFTNSNTPKLKTLIRSNIEIGSRKTESETSKQNAINLYIEQNIHLLSRSSINIRNTSTQLNSSNILFNELFQIGGATTLRGFNEKSIFASSFNYSNLEYRLQSGSQSYLYSFSDIGFTKNKVDNTSNTYTSFGVGYSYKTKTGTIDLNYAIGKTKTTNFDFNKGLLHIKFVNIF